jgi:hypothetical protein
MFFPCLQEAQISQFYEQNYFVPFDLPSRLQVKYVIIYTFVYLLVCLFIGIFILSCFYLRHYIQITDPEGYLKAYFYLLVS